MGEKFRYKLTLEYDGMSACGWQRQKDAPSMQEMLEKALFLLCGVPSTVFAAGRTDAGVHALGQVVHVDLPKFYEPFVVQEALNFYVSSMAVISVEIVSPSFHARFSATERTYLYKIINRRPPPILEHNRAWHILRPLDLAAMEEASQLLVGSHDFTSFRATTCQSASPFKTLNQLTWKKQGITLEATIKARSFLHHQVRIMIGTLALVGKGKWTPQEVQEALAAKDRRRAGPTAPPHGLYFAHVAYGDG